MKEFKKWMSNLREISIVLCLTTSIILEILFMPKRGQVLPMLYVFDYELFFMKIENMKWSKWGFDTF